MNTNITSFPRRSFIIGAAAVGVTAMVDPKFAFADEITDKQAEADAAYASMQAMQDTLDQTSDDYTQAINDQQEAESKMDEAQTQIDDANNQISGLQGRLSDRARSMYRNGTSSFLDVFTNSTSWEEFTTGLDALKTMNDQDADLVSNIKDERQKLQDARDEYASQAETARQKADDAKQAQQTAEATLAQYTETYNSLSAEVAALVEQKRQAEEAAAAAAAAATVQASADQGAQAEAAAASNDSGSSDNGGGSNGGGSSSNSGGSNGGSSSSNSGSGSKSSGGSSNSGSGSKSSGGGSSSSGSSSKGSSGGSGKSYDGGGDVVSRAYACIGAPYVWGAVGPQSYDCSGLVSYCISGRHQRIYTSSSLNAMPAVSNPSPGDVCVRSGHCGIYIGNGQMIHAPHTGATVCVTSVQSGMKIVRP